MRDEETTTREGLVEGIIPSDTPEAGVPSRNQTERFLSRLGRADSSLVREQIATLTSIQRSFNPTHIPIYIALKILLATGILALIEGVSLLWRPLGIFFYSLTLPYLVFAIYLRFKGTRGKELSRIEGALLTFVEVLVDAMILVVSFSQLCKYLALSLHGGFSPPISGYWSWFSFGLSQLLDNALYGVFSAYNITLSEVHAIAIWSQTLVFVFNLILSSLVVAAILGEFRLIWQTKETSSS